MTDHQFSLAEQFWNDIDFEGKEYTKVDQNLILTNPGNHWPEKELIEWSVHTKVEDFHPFIDKFKQWKEECEELALELKAQPELSQLSKIESLIKQGLEEKMIGDIHPHITALEQGRQELNQMHQIRLIDLENILQSLESINQNGEWTQETLTEANQIMELWDSKTSYEHDQLNPYIRRWNDLKTTFNKLKSEFLDQRSIERMHNMDLKMQICEEAEAAKDSTDWKSTSTLMENLLDRWKNIGLAPSFEKNEELWERFRTARQHFFDRRTEFFDAQKVEEEKNLAEKLSLIEEAEQLIGAPWRKNDERHQQIMAAWKKIGKVPYDQIETIWERLQKARDTFYEAKRENARQFRETLEENFKIKTALTEKAESLQNSELWRETTVAMNELMEQWKSVGRLSREHGDELWERFIKARRTFFDRKDANRESYRKKQEERNEQRFEFLRKDIDELKMHIKDEEEKLKEFSESIDRLTGDDPKDIELREHLKNLIEKINNELPKKIKKLQDMEAKLS